MSGRWVISEPRVIPHNIDETLTTQMMPLGSRVRARDTSATNNQGEGEFVYLKGVAATAAGDVVEYDNNAGTTTRWAGTANKGKPLAVAMSANVANQFGWYQVEGLSVANISGVVAAGDSAYWQATATISSTAVAGKQLMGAIAVSANGVPSAGKALYQLTAPHGQGQIT